MLDDAQNLAPQADFAERAVDSESAEAPFTQLLSGDAEAILDSIPDNSIQLCVTSPPYNIGKSYERDYRRTLEEYRQWCERIIIKVSAKLKEGGSVCIQVGNYVKDDLIVPLDYIYYPILEAAGLNFRNRVIWRFNFGLHAKNRLSGRYEVLLWFTKGSKYKFNLDPIRVPQLYPGKRHSAKKGELAGQPSGNPLGKNPSDYWEFSPHSAFIDEPVWNIPNVKANHPEKTEHPCQYPVELVERCVLAFTDPGDTILDPFAGIGTSLVAAVGHGRNSIGIELCDDYIQIAHSRIASARLGKLPTRKSGRPVRQPMPQEKVARLPTEWLTDGGSENGD